MRQKIFAKKRKLKASDETNPSGLADASTTSQNVDADVGKHPRSYAGGQFAGYIFMCNTKTKPDCFTYRVFGLPASMIGVVEKIKPNTKLFLYDFEVKLLYGLYVADSIGKLALEPYAFQGRFPAQVKFSIAKDCLPLPVAAFKDAIGYTGSKFKQDLSYEQVNRLVSLFRPITVLSPPQVSLSFHSAARGPHHDVLRRSSYRHVQEVPLLSLHSSQRQIAVTRVGELASDPSHSSVTYKRYASAYPHQAYHPDDPDIQQHDSRVRYGHIPTISPRQLQPLTPPTAVRSSSLTAAQWVAMAANTGNSGDPSSTFKQSSSSGPGVSHGNSFHDGSSYTEAGHGYQNWGYPGTHEAVSVPIEQPVPVHIESQGDPVLPHTSQSVSGGAVAVDPYPYYNSTSSTGVSYGHENRPYSGYHQTPTVSAHQEVNNFHAYEMPSGYSQAISEGRTGYGYENQGYTGYYQAPSETGGQGVVNDFPVNAYENLPASTSRSYVQSQGVPALLQTQPSVSGVDVENAYLYYHQGYYNSHHMAPIFSHQEVNIVPAQASGISHDYGNVCVGI